MIVASCVFRVHLYIFPWLVRAASLLHLSHCTQGHTGCHNRSLPVVGRTLTMEIAFICGKLLTRKQNLNVVFNRFWKPLPLQTISIRTMASDDDWKSKKSVYEFTAADIDGNLVSLDKYKGKPTIIVNVATNCGYTKNNYAQLNELFDKYESQGFRVAAFPCNQFGGQEPGCDVDIKEFIKKKGVRFDMYSKVDVNGDNAIPLYKWLKEKQGGILGFDGIKWNFTKFLIDKQGLPIKRYSPNEDPIQIEPDIKAAL